jgi:hypothetical protein
VLEYRCAASLEASSRAASQVHSASAHEPDPGTQGVWSAGGTDVVPSTADEQVACCHHAEERASRSIAAKAALDSRGKFPVAAHERSCLSPADNSDAAVAADFAAKTVTRNGARVSAAIPSSSGAASGLCGAGTLDRRQQVESRLPAAMWRDPSMRSIAHRATLCHLPDTVRRMKHRLRKSVVIQGALNEARLSHQFLAQSVATGARPPFAPPSPGGDLFSGLPSPSEVGEYTATITLPCLQTIKELPLPKDGLQMLLDLCEQVCLRRCLTVCLSSRSMQLIFLRARQHRGITHTCFS